MANILQSKGGDFCQYIRLQVCNYWNITDTPSGWGRIVWAPHKRNCFLAKVAREARAEEAKKKSSFTPVHFNTWITNRLIIIVLRGRSGEVEARTSGAIKVLRV
jgi:hypothetical protein